VPPANRTRSLHIENAHPYRITTKENALPFQQVAMDLITGLPTHNGKDAILTIVDHGCSRAAIFLPCTTKITGPGIAQLYLDHVYKWFGLPSKSSLTETPASHPTSEKHSPKTPDQSKPVHSLPPKLMASLNERTNGWSNTSG